MKRYWLYLGYLPLLAVLPHWWQVLRSSPVDRFNLLVCGLVAAVLSLLLLKSKPKMESSSRSVVFLVAMMLSVAVFLFGLLWLIWLISMTAAIGCAWLTTGAILGWHRGWRILPAFVALMLAVPQVLFWGTRLGNDFVGGMHPACQLEFSRLQRNVTAGESSAGTTLPAGWLARKVAVSDQEKLLFRTGEIVKWEVLVDDILVGVSEATLREDRHELHPLSFCLKSQGYVVLSEQMVMEDDLAVVELKAERNGDRVVIWSWYTDHCESTASFIRFRMRSSYGWKRYSLMASDAAATRTVFSQVLKYLR